MNDANRKDPGECGGGHDPLDCRQVFRRLDDYLDRALTPAELAQVSAHLEACSPCAEELGFSADLIAGVKAKLRRIQAPEGVKDRLAQMLASNP